MKRKHETYAKENKLDGVHYVSAKSGYNVMTVFYQVTADILGRNAATTCTFVFIYSDTCTPIHL